jgi:hypothetical protein
MSIGGRGVIPKPSPERPLVELSDNLREVLNLSQNLTQKLNQWFQERKEMKLLDFEDILSILKEIRTRLLMSPEMVEWLSLRIKPGAYLIRTYAISGVASYRASIRLLFLYLQGWNGIITRLGNKASADHSTAMQTLDKLIIKHLKGIIS